MKRKMFLFTALAAGSAMFTAVPAQATWSWWGTHTHYCNCGHTASGCGGSTTTSSGGTTTTSGGTTTTSGGTTTTSGGTTTTSGGTTTTSGGTTTTSGGTTTSTGGTPSTSGGTSVPEPGMVGLMGLSLLGLGIARRRKARRA